MTKKTTASLLYELAEPQQGFFTTRQAQDAGFSKKNHAYHVQAGHWVREYRGIFRLANFPRPDQPDLMLWYLWSRNQKQIPQGVYSHQTALTLYDLSDLMPAKLHMTVPLSFRRRVPVPKILVLHYSDLTKNDISKGMRVSVTTPLRTLCDVVKEGSLSKDIIRQAVRDSLSRGLVRQGEIEKIPSLAPFAHPILIGKPA